jgi:hypothetical protein
VSGSVAQAVGQLVAHGVLVVLRGGRNRLEALEAVLAALLDRGEPLLQAFGVVPDVLGG